MQKIKKNKLMSIFLALGLCSLIFAGPNKSASVAVDLDGSTAAVSEGDAVTFAVVAKDVSDLHSYSVKIRYNAKVLEFKGAKKSASGQDCFIETAGGKLLTFLVNPKENEIEIAATLKGKAEGQTVNGNGALGVFSFEGISEGVSGIEIVEVKLLDSKGALDKVVALKVKKSAPTTYLKEGGSVNEAQ